MKLDNRMKLIIMGWILVVMGLLTFFDGFPLGLGPVWYQVVKIVAGLYLLYSTRQRKPHTG